MNQITKARIMLVIGLLGLVATFVLRFGFRANDASDFASGLSVVVLLYSVIVLGRDFKRKNTA